LGRRLGVVLLLAVLLAAPAGAKPGATRLTIFAAASLTEAFQSFDRNETYSFAGSNTLAAQIQQGAPADVFASASPQYTQDLYRRKLVEKPVTFASNRLVLIVPKSNPARIGKLQDLSRGGVKIVIASDAVPVGHYSRTVFRNLSRAEGFPSDFATRALRNVVSEEENVKSVVSKVQLGEADAALVYRSDVTPAVARYVRLFEIPDSANVIATYPIALLKDGPAHDAAKAFIDLVLSANGQRVLERRGLMPVAANAP